LTGAWVQDATYESVVDPGEIVAVNVTIGYSFDVATEISPGIYSKMLDDWVVDEFVEVTGTGQTSYILEFSAPEISGSYEYEANVYFFTDGNWFNLGKGAVQNMTIEVTGTVTTLLEYTAEIDDVQVPGTIGLDEEFLLDVTVSYDFDEETDIVLVLNDPVTESIIVETQDTLEGTGSKVYSFDMTSPSVVGVYEMDVMVSYFNGLEWDDSGEGAIQRITQEVVEPVVPPTGIPWIYVGIGILIVGIAGFLYYQKSKES